MAIPSWKQFTKGLTDFECSINDILTNRIEKFQNKHPLIDKAIRTSISILPSPFDTIAEAIYETSSGSEDEKSNSIINYLKVLESKGENHYNSITSKLDYILTSVDDIKIITAKEDSLLKIKEILINTGSNTNEKINELNNEIYIIKLKLDDIVNNQQKIVSMIGNALHNVDNFYPQIQAYEAKDRNVSKFQPSILAEIDDTKIIFRDTKFGGTKDWLTITGDELYNLDSSQLKLIKIHEEKMEKYFDEWELLYHQEDPYNESTDKKLKDIAYKICSEWSKIIKYLGLIIGKKLEDHYGNIFGLCEQYGYVHIRAP